MPLEIHVKREGDKFVRYDPERDSVPGYETTDHTWERYQFLTAELASVESAILEHPFTPDDPDDIKALRAAGLSQAEIDLIIATRQSAVGTPAPVPQEIDANLSPGQTSILPEEYPSKAPCPKNKRGQHVPASYRLMENGRVDGICACGEVLQDVPCPHQQQRLLGKTIVCGWCNSPILRNAGVVQPPAGIKIEEGEQPGAHVIDIGKFRA